MDENAARIQTVSSVPCPHGAHADSPYASRRGSYFYDDVVCLRAKGGDWWQITELHPPLMCDNGGDAEHVEFIDGIHESGDDGTWVGWYDGSPGAVPHTKPEPAPAKRVTTDMKFAAWNLLIGRHPWDKFSPNDVRDAIEAALAAEDK
jgi:hypothetical protein